MKGIICEFPWQVRLLKESDTKDIVAVSVDPTVSYELRKKNIEHLEASQICLHEEIWDQYKRLTKNCLRITGLLDEMLWEVDGRFKELDLKVFDGLHYVIKICHDQAIYYVHLIDELFRRFDITAVACANVGDVTFDEDGLYHIETSLFKELLKGASSKYTFDIEYHNNKDSVDEVSKKSRFSFGQPRRYAKSHVLFQFINIYKRCSFALQTLFDKKKKTVLSVGCKEVDTLFQTCTINELQLLKYNPYISYTDGGRPWRYLDDFKERLFSDDGLRSFLSYRSIDFSAPLYKCILFFAEKLGYLLDQCKKAFKLLDKLQLHCVVFHTMAPFYPPNIFIQNYCRQKNIPYYCWMHGGYGAYYSLAGYDVVDYRLCDRHVVYGEVLKDLMLNEKCIINELDVNIAIADLRVNGSPFFDELYRSYKRPRNARKKVLFSIGNKYQHNQFYFGFNRPNSEMSIWDAHYEILKTLTKYQDRYDIIVKDYPYSESAPLWQGILEDLSAHKVDYIREERNFFDLLVEADMHIFTWVSTTFFQSLYTDADIFLYDNSDLTDESRDVIGKYVAFSDDIKTFNKMLAAYLEAGNFYTQDKTELRNYYLDFENRDKRGELFVEMVSKL